MINNVKKAIAILVALTLILSFSSCAAVDELTGALDSAVQTIEDKLDETVSGISGMFASFTGNITDALSSLIPKAETDEDKIVKVVQKFEKSVNKCDYSGMLECFEPYVSKGFGSMLNLAGGLSGALLGIDIDLQDIVNLMPLLADSGLLEMSGGEMPKIKLSVDDIQINEDAATATLTAKVTRDGQTETASAPFSFVRDNGEWYFSLSSLMS